MRSLGSRLRSLYVDQLQFLPRNFDSNAISLRSTNYARTIESLQSVVLGLYPAEYVSTDQVIPMSTRHERQETMFEASNCAKLSNLLNELSQLYKQKFGDRNAALHQKYSWFFEDGQRVLGKNLGTQGFYDVMTCLHRHDYPLPHSTNMHDMKDAEELCLNREYMPFQLNKQVARLGIGRFIRELVEPIEAVTGSSAPWNSTTKKPSTPQQPAKKLYIYSGHDATLGPVLGAFGMLDGKSWPLFGENIIIETLVKKQSNETKENKPCYFVRIKYNEKSRVIPSCKQAAMVPGIGNGGDASLCPLDAFMAICDELVPRDFVQECSFHDGTVAKRH